MMKKAKGVVLLEAFLALMLMTMASYGLAAVNSVQFSQLIASADANQAKNYAEMEAQYLKQLGYDDVVDENYDEDEPSRTPRYPNGKNSTDDKASNARDMTKFLGATEGAKWRSTATLGETISNIGGDVDNKIQNVIVSVYKASDGADASPRATVTVPLSTQAGSGLTPVGGIIVWPKDSDPSTSSNIWLECNGQTFDTSRFKKLYKVLGSNRVPNYQGMFLRGAGSQTFSQKNGDYFTYKDGRLLQTYGNKTTFSYTSGNIGEIQGDGTREFRVGSNASFGQIDLAAQFPEIYFDGLGIQLSPNAYGWFNWYDTAIPGIQRDFYVPTNPKHYRYKLNYSTSTDEDGNQVIDDISLDEYTSPVEDDEAERMVGGSEINVNAMSLVAPVANEIRPVNIAVKYYIRAK